LVEDVELVEGPHALWDGHFWTPCPACNAGAWRPTPTASLILNGSIPAPVRQQKVAPAGEAAGATNGALRAQTTDSSHCSTKGAKRQLAALVFYHCVTSDTKAVHRQKLDDSPGVKSAYRLVKLYSDGATAPVADADVDAAIEFITEHYKCRDFGYWLNDAQALVWATLPQDFERAWGAPTLRCPCRYSRHSERYERKTYIDRLVRVGSKGYIVPTREGRLVVALRSRFPTFSGDALWAPIEVMEAERQREEELARRLAGSPLFAGRQARAARQEATLPWPHGK
jgi:hypothetical protein